MKPTKRLPKEKYSTPKPEETKPSRGKPLAENSTIPLVSVLDDRSTMRRATKLLKDAHEQKKIKDDAEKKVKEYREELASIALVEELSGLRYGNLAIQVNGYISRSTFNKEKAKALMLEYGVPPEKIAKCYEQGEEYLDTKLVELL